jgi:hypothetical protein
MATHGSQVLAGEPRLEIQGVLTKDRLPPKNARDKMRLMFKQKEAHRKEKEKLGERKKKSKAEAKENTKKAGKKKAPKKKLVDPKEVHVDELDDNESLEGLASEQQAT